MRPERSGSANALHAISSRLYLVSVQFEQDCCGLDRVRIVVYYENPQGGGGCGGDHDSIPQGC